MASDAMRALYMSVREDFRHSLTDEDLKLALRLTDDNKISFPQEDLLMGLFNAMWVKVEAHFENEQKGIQAQLISKDARIKELEESLTQRDKKLSLLHTILDAY